LAFILAVSIPFDMHASLRISKRVTLYVHYKLELTAPTHGHYYYYYICNKAELQLKARKTGFLHTSQHTWVVG